MKKELNDFLEERPELKNERNRTVNIPDSVHNFYKSTANNFGIKLTDLISNILIEWQNHYGDDIKNELIKNIRKRF